MPSNMSQERKQMLKFYGARLIEVGEGDFDEAIRVRDEMAEKMGWFSCNQFHNQLNIEAHYNNTGPELANQITKNGAVEFDIPVALIFKF